MFGRIEQHMQQRLYTVYSKYEAPTLPRKAYADRTNPGISRIQSILPSSFNSAKVASHTFLMLFW